MKGKNKLIFMLCAFITLVMSGVIFALGVKPKQIASLNAAVDIQGFSAKLEGDVIFSAERIYMAQDQSVELKYNEGYTFNKIETNSGSKYFGDIGLRNAEDYSNKHFIKNGSFLMLDDRAEYRAQTTSTPVANPTVKQGIMVTVGGYYLTNDGEIKRNHEYTDGNDTVNEMEYVSVSATLNGRTLTLPSARSYNNQYQDFTWFIPAVKDNPDTEDIDESTEGHYVIEVLYSVGGQTKPIYVFEFYLLFQSSYDEPVEVNDQNYDSAPTMTNATVINDSASSKDYTFFSGTTQYPTLTFDYARYKLRYKHTSGDVQRESVFAYDEQNNQLTLTTQVYNDVEIKRYPIKFNDNTIISLMFSDIGIYSFDFSYIYNSGDEKIDIPETDFDYKNINLTIHGYQLKYSKAGFVSADMTYLEVYQNGTMFILVNGFIDESKETASAVGINYKLIENTTHKTGEINTVNSKSGDVTSLVKGGSSSDLDVEDNISYQKTDRGLWLTLNDKYYFTTDVGGPVLESYYYSSSNEIDLEELPAQEPFRKVTTFTAPGYYLIRVCYIYDDANHFNTQWFAFQIVSAIPKLELYKTKAEVYGDDIEKTEFYANEYTNQNVYAYWAETGVFESKINGILYYVEDEYAVESDLKSVANGYRVPNVTKQNYEKYSMITDSASYLMVLEVARTATKTYTYFTIDKEAISGLEVYEVQIGSIDNKAVYTIKRDAELNYISHTSKSSIDASFTLDWANKRSRAGIQATYKFTPFIKSGTSSIKIETPYTYMINEYIVGSTSNPISIFKPSGLNSILNVDNVLTEQGIYEFELKDDAGNICKYIVVIDRTELVIKATYGDEKLTYTSGEMVSDYVELEWGTHKAINLSSATENATIQKLIAGSRIDYYYTAGGNLSNLFYSFRKIDGVNMFVVENKYTTIKPFSNNGSNTYIINNDGSKQVQYPNNSYGYVWDDWANTIFTNVTNKGVKINIDSSIGRYSVSVVSNNKVSTRSNNVFQVAITPDKAQGTVYSANADSNKYEREVRAHGQDTKYLDQLNPKDEEIDISKYYDGQASNDGLFVFEWIPKDENKFEVTEVRYNYYQLMSQDALNNPDVNRDVYRYYPYKYISSTHIYKKVDNIEQIKLCDTKTRDGRTVYQSEPLNLGYETYYNEYGELVSKKVTQTGLYIITRVISTKDEVTGLSQNSEFSYVFFVDRNAIVGYSINDVNDKIVGQFIHMSMPNSTGEVFYDNFLTKGVNKGENTYIDANGNEEDLAYSIYLQTNKMPTQVKVPSGKYVTGIYENVTQTTDSESVKDNTSIRLTSHINLKLKLSVYFLDTNKLLSTSKQADSPVFVKLMTDKTASIDNYMNLTLANIDNPALITEFKNARIHSSDNSLSLPGLYVFVITDTVGKELSDWEVSDYNKFIFAVELKNWAPETDVYAYPEIDGEPGSKTYADGYDLYTNQANIDFEIPVENLNAYNAQLDIASIKIYRSPYNRAGSRVLWLGLTPSGDGFVANPSGLIQNTTPVRLSEDGSKYIISLDGGINEVDGNNITNYSEYHYEIEIQYILSNSSKDYYTYKDGNTVKQFYTSTYNVYIDRTPNTTNLDKLMSTQGDYFTDYHRWLTDNYEAEFDGNINTKFAYRHNSSGDYYAVTNDLYYQYLEQDNHELTNLAMYALTVDSKTAIDKSDLALMYYREVEFLSELTAEARMGLLPITDTYFDVSSGFHTFREDLVEYTQHSMENPYLTYAEIILNATANPYADKYGKYYEIIEKDKAGNFTQYVIYFEKENKTPEDRVNIKVVGTNLTDNTGDAILTFGDNDMFTFVGINNIESVGNLIGKNEDDKMLQYYGNINIYNASREKIKTIYTNSKTQHDSEGIPGIEGEIYQTIKEQGNYIIEYINVFGEKSTGVINNYTTDEHMLNVASLQLKEDQMRQKYIEISGVNKIIDANTYWFVKSVTIKYKDRDGRSREVIYTAGPPNEGKSNLVWDETSDNQIDVRLMVPDRLNLADNIQYLVILEDVIERKLTVPISTSEDYYSYKWELPSNVYVEGTNIYTANELKFSFNSELYSSRIELMVDGELKAGADLTQYYISTTANGYTTYTLKPDVQSSPADYLGSIREFKVWITLNGEDESDIPSYTATIDTRAIHFAIENTNRENKIEFVKSSIKNSGGDYSIDELRDKDFYTTLIGETINIKWSKIDSEYFTYSYQLFEYLTADTYKELLTGTGEDSYTISPKQSNIGKYIFKVTIYGLNGEWISSRVYAIFMTTSISGLYEVKDGDGNVYDYATITNLHEILINVSNLGEMAHELGYGASITAMQNDFHFFGMQTAIPMYISNTDLTLHSNKDNGVDNKYYEIETSSYTTIRFYRVWRTNYQTFALIMRVEPSNRDQNILTTLQFTTRGSNTVDLLSSGTNTTIYDADAQYYRLVFSSWNSNMDNNNELEVRNKIIIDISYNNNIETTRIIGGDTPTTTIDFKYAGNYQITVRDVSGNVQHFRTTTSTVTTFNIVVMKEVLYTINGSAPVQYAYYDSDVTLQINRYNEITGKNNYDINSIKVNVTLNGKPYTGYEHAGGSAKYVFKDYGTYVIYIEANLLNSPDKKPISQLIFTIINPNEARNSIDFTPIYGYNITSIFSITNSGDAEVSKDVTSKFMELLQDKANNDSIDLYNKLLTYDRAIKSLGSATQGKLKFRVEYEVVDELLPKRVAQFTFTLNNQKATINSSIEAGEKTTKEVTLKFNAANIYDQIGDCYIVINGEKVVHIVEGMSNTVSTIVLKDVGEYYVQLVGDSGNISTSFNFTIKEPLNVVAIILICVVVGIVLALVGTFIWLRTRMKVR